MNVACVCSESELKTCCGVLSKLLDAVDHTAVLSNFHSELLLGLDSQSETVHQLCLVQVFSYLLILSVLSSPRFTNYTEVSNVEDTAGMTI